MPERVFLFGATERPGPDPDPLGLNCLYCPSRAAYPNMKIFERLKGPIGSYDELARLITCPDPINSYENGTITDEEAKMAWFIAIERMENIGLPLLAEEGRDVARRLGWLV